MKLLLSAVLVFNGFFVLTGIKSLEARASITVKNRTKSKLVYTSYNKKNPIALRENIFTPRILLSFPKKQKDLGLKNYTQAISPILLSQQQTEEVILPDEIIVSFDEEVPKSRQRSILQKHNLKVIRKLRFSTNHYLVKPTSVSRTGILDITYQLDRVNGVRSAGPNFYRKFKTH